jgi:hypothetical protein
MTSKPDPIRIWGKKDQQELGQQILDILNSVDHKYKQTDKLCAFFYAAMEREKLAARLDELNHTDGLFKCFKTTDMPVMKRIAELREQLATLNKREK